MTTKTDQILELEIAALTVLHANRDLPTYEAFREAFASHLRNTYMYSEFAIEQALLDVDRDEVELPRLLSFVKPASQHVQYRPEVVR